MMSLFGARACQVVNGPEVLSKYVGQAEENIRNLFGEAEAEYKEKGDSSVSLHLAPLQWPCWILGVSKPS